MQRLLILTLLAACLAGFGLAHLRLSGGLSAHPLNPAELVRPRTTGQVLPAADWFDEILRGLRRQDGPREDWDRRWERRRDRLISPFEDEERRRDRPIRPFEDEEWENRTASGGYFRTMCVRLCDGFPIPMSFSTTRSQFPRDARRCAQICPGGRLFAYRNPGGEMEDMVDLDGRPYRQLPTAFLHQSSYVENCTCHGNPWDQEALARHQSYAAHTTPQSATAAERKLKPPPRREGRRSPERWVQNDMEDRERR
jgi:Protein of unknown function (DUF2865)